VVPYSGTYVFDISERDLEDLSEMRAAVEGAAIRAAMARQPGALAAALAEAVEGMAAAHAAGDNPLARARDGEFHAACLRLAGNEYLTGAYSQIEGKLDALRFRCTSPHDVRNAIAAHRRILDAVRDGDQERAAAAVTRHVRDARAVYRQILALRNPAAAPA
jgi:DNA-binding GntR family transcriptional regulator